MGRPRTATVLRRFMDGARIVDLECEFDVDSMYVEQCIRRGLRGEVKIERKARR